MQRSCFADLLGESTRPLDIDTARGSGSRHPSEQGGSSVPCLGQAACVVAVARNGATNAPLRACRWHRDSAPASRPEGCRWRHRPPERRVRGLRLRPLRRPTRAAARRGAFRPAISSWVHGRAPVRTWPSNGLARRMTQAGRTSQRACQRLGAPQEETVDRRPSQICNAVGHAPVSSTPPPRTRTAQNTGLQRPTSTRDHRLASNDPCDSRSRRRDPRRCGRRQPRMASRRGRPWCVDDRRIPAGALLLTVPCVLALVNLIAFFPARAAAQTRPAVALRSE